MLSGTAAPSRVTIIPTECPKFVAACFTAGIEFQKGTPGISNTYTKGRKYDPNEPGDIKFYLSDDQGINPHAIARAWLWPDRELETVAQIFNQLTSCRDFDLWQELANELEASVLLSGVAHMSLFCRRTFSVDKADASLSEVEAARILDEIPKAMRRATSMNGASVAIKVKAAWNPAMFAWVKAWISNYKGIAGAWKHANPSIKIDRPGHLMPLVIPKGKDFKRLLQRWA